MFARLRQPALAAIDAALQRYLTAIAAKSPPLFVRQGENDRPAVARARSFDAGVKVKPQAPARPHGRGRRDQAVFAPQIVAARGEIKPADVFHRIGVGPETALDFEQVFDLRALRVVVPQALPGVLTGTILAVSRASGEVAPLLFVGAAYFLPHLPSLSATMGRR